MGSKADTSKICVATPRLRLLSYFSHAWEQGECATLQHLSAPLPLLPQALPGLAAPHLSITGLDWLVLERGYFQKKKRCTILLDRHFLFYQAVFSDFYESAVKSYQRQEFSYTKAQGNFGGDWPVHTFLHNAKPCSFACREVCRDGTGVLWRHASQASASRPPTHIQCWQGSYRRRKQESEGRKYIHSIWRCGHNTMVPLYYIICPAGLKLF